MEKIKPFLMPGAVVIAGMFIAGAVVWSNTEDCSAEGDDSQVAGRVVEAAELERTVELKQYESVDGMALGDPDAPVEVVEYSDYACPFCARHWGEVMPQIMDQYISQGEVRYVYRDLPVVGGARAAEAARCAGEQGDYWRYHDVLFSRQQQDRERWSDVNIHQDYAEFLDLDAEELAECFTEGRYQDEVAASAQEAQELGGEGTPFFVINGQTLAGAQPFPVFSSVIDEFLE